jgi:hypothetical protein
VSTTAARPRKTIRPPSGYDDLLSRRQAAAMLGFASEFKVRELQKQGRLRAVRGVMGSAWYPRLQVVALRDALAAPPPPAFAADATAAHPAPSGRWSDAQLVAHLRGRARAADGSGATRPRTPVDLVAETGISIARAERVYRFWLAHDVHPVADEARQRAGRAPAAATPPSERRSEARVEHDALLRQMRDADPAIRAAAFVKLRERRP